MTHWSSLVRACRSRPMEGKARLVIVMSSPVVSALRPRTTSAAHRRAALVGLSLSALTTGLDITITNLALPSIGRDLHARTSELQWVMDAYTIVVAGLLVAGGGLADRYGRRRVVLAGYALFGAASFLAAFSPTSELLIAARALMGVGAAATLAPAIGVWSAFGAMGLALGPILGGLLFERFAWGSVFLVVVSVVAVGVLVGLHRIPESFGDDRGRLDVPDALVSVSYTHLRAHETDSYLVCRLL